MTPWDDLPAVERYVQSVQADVDHSLYTLRSIAWEMKQGFDCNPTKRRAISASKDEIAAVVASLSKMLGEIEAADTCQVERR